MSNLPVKWILAIATAAVTLLGVTASAFACDPAPHCASYVQAPSEVPDCLEFEDTLRFYDRQDCPWEIVVRSQCDGDVEFVEQNCGDDCAEPFVIEAGEEAVLPLEMPEEAGILEQEFQWSYDGSDGQLLTRADHTPYAGDPCSDDPACQQASPGGPSGPLMVLLLVMTALGLKNRRTLAAKARG